MFELIEKLRQKPDSAKKKIAFFVALLTSGIIFVVWLSVIYPNWKLGQSQKEKVANLEPSPVSSLSSTISSGFSAIKDQFSQVKNVISSFSSSPAHYNSTTSETIATSTKE